MKIIHIINVIAAVLLSLQIGYAAPKEAEFNKVSESWELKADGSQIYHMRKELTIFTHTAMNNTYGETFITYNPLFQELEINESYTVQTDGTIIKTPANAFVEVLPADAAGMPAYNHLKEMVVVHTGLELGATIVLDYSIVSKPGYLPEIDVCKTLLQTSPVKEYEVSFTYPAGKTLHYSLIADQTQPLKNAENGSETMIWKFNNLPAMPRVPETSLQNGDIPGIAVSTYASNAEALKQVYEQFDAPETFAELTAEVTKDCKKMFDKFNAIYDYVLNGIASCPLSFEAAGYRIRPAKEVIASAYATEMEKVNILNGMIKAAGFTAEPGAAYDVDVDINSLGLNAVSKWMSVATLGRAHVFYLDAFSKMPAASTSEFVVMLNDGSRVDRRDVTKTITYRADINFNGDAANAQIYSRFSNHFLPNYKITAADMLHLDEVTSWDHDCTYAVFEGNSSVKTEKAGDFTIVTLPSTFVDVNNYRYAAYNSERATNLLLPFKFDEMFEYTISIPEGMEYNTADMIKEVTNSVGTMKVSICKVENQIVVKRSISTDERLILPEKYGEFKMLMNEWNDPHMKQVVFRKIAK